MGEIILVFLVVLMLFGSKKIPDLARSFGKGMNEFRKATDDIKREFEKSTSEIKDELSDIESGITQNSNYIRDAAEDAYKDDYGTRVNTIEDVYGLNGVAENTWVEPETTADEITEDNKSVKQKKITRKKK